MVCNYLYKLMMQLHQRSYHMSLLTTLTPCGTQMTLAKVSNLLRPQNLSFKSYLRDEALVIKKLAV